MLDLQYPKEENIALDRLYFKNSRHLARKVNYLSATEVLAFFDMIISVDSIMLEIIRNVCGTAGDYG